jgi:CheY-like chemotaxis protein
MASKSLLEGKKVLVVDDEPDVLETLKELLPMCHVTGAESFKKARELLQTQHFDMAILDIMGVDGYRLLKVAKSRDVIAVMANIETFLNDILEAKHNGENSWSRWLERFGSFFTERFGSDWRDKYKEFWTKPPPD